MGFLLFGFHPFFQIINKYYVFYPFLPKIWYFILNTNKKSFKQTTFINFLGTPRVHYLMETLILVIKSFLLITVIFVNSLKQSVNVYRPIDIIKTLYSSFYYFIDYDCLLHQLRFYVVFLSVYFINGTFYGTTTSPLLYTICLDSSFFFYVVPNLYTIFG